MVGGCSLNQRNMQDLMSYNPATGEWQKLPSMTVARFQMGVAVLDDYLYVVGGTHRQQVLSSVERYSFKKVLRHITIFICILLKPVLVKELLKYEHFKNH